MCHVLARCSLQLDYTSQHHNRTESHKYDPGTADRRRIARNIGLAVDNRMRSRSVMCSIGRPPILANPKGACAVPLTRRPSSETRYLSPLIQTEPHWFLSRSSTSSAQSPTETPVTIDSCSFSRRPE
jgi:hypothetical protein